MHLCNTAYLWLWGACEIQIQNNFWSFLYRFLLADLKWRALERLAPAALNYWFGWPNRLRGLSLLYFDGCRDLHARQLFIPLLFSLQTSITLNLVNLLRQKVEHLLQGSRLLQQLSFLAVQSRNAFHILIQYKVMLVFIATLPCILSQTASSVLSERCGVADIEQSQYSSLLNSTASIYQKLHEPTYYAGTLYSYYANNLSLLQSDLSPAIQPIIFNIGPFALLAVLMLALGLPLLGCCFWPDQCPSKYLKKNERQNYSDSQLYFPFGLSTALLCLAAGCALAVFFMRGVYTQGVADGQCKLSRFVSNFQNGANGTYSNKSTFFKGYSGISATTDYLISNYSAELARFQSAYSKITDIKSSLAAASTGLATVYSGYTDVTYSNAFTDSAGSIITVSSQFKGLYLGPSSRSGSVLGTLSEGIASAQSQLNKVFDPVISSLAVLQASSTGPLATASPVLKATSARIDQLSRHIQPTPYRIPLPTQDLLLSLLGLGLFALCLLAIVTSSGVVFGNRKCLVKLHGVTLTLLYLFVVFGVAVAGFMAFASVAMYQQCRYVQSAVNSSYSIVIEGQGFSDISPQISVCAGNQSFLPLKNIDSNFYSIMAGFRTVSETVQNFTSLLQNYSNAEVDSTVAAANLIIDNVKANNLLDVNDTQAIIFFSNLASNNLPAGTCNFNLQYDSWLPSAQLASPVCSSDAVSRPLCADISSTGLCPLGCYSFTTELDLTGTAGDTAPGSDQWLTKLKSRYGLSCNYATYLSNIKNYDSVRVAAMNSLKATLQTQVYSHLTSATTAFTALSAQMITLNASLTASQHFSTRFGSTSGLDCYAQQEHLDNVGSSFCGPGLVGAQTLLILLGVGTYLGAIGLCLQVAGVSRIQLQRKKEAQRIIDLSKAMGSDANWIPESEMYRIL